MKCRCCGEEKILREYDVFDVVNKKVKLELCIKCYKEIMSTEPVICRCCNGKLRYFNANGEVYIFAER